jgi:hypothetical protein
MRLHETLQARRHVSASRTAGLAAGREALLLESQRKSIGQRKALG